MKKSIFTLAMALFSSVTLFAQTEATTNDGRKVILNDDGTWIDNPETPSKSDVSLDCSDLISTEVDKVTGKSSTGAKDILIISDDGGKSGFGIYMLNSSRSLIFSIQAVGAGNCIDDDDKINVLFRDGTRLELQNDGKFNCEAKFTLYFGGVFGKNKELEMFKTKEIETIRVWTSKSYIEKNLTTDQSKQFMKTVECLSNNK